MAVFSTPENGKDKYLKRTLQSLSDTVDFSRHRLQLSVNAFTPETMIIFNEFKHIIDDIIFNSENIGTAEAINKVWARRQKGENAIKMDDDVVINTPDWLYLMEESIRRNRYIGQIGLKRRDCMENTTHGDPFYKSELIQAPHKPGEKWIIWEKVSHVMGTCVMFSDTLLNKIGYLYQPGLYGFDDSFASVRSKVAGFINVFLVGVDIEHIDPGGGIYQEWKLKEADKVWNQYQGIVRSYMDGTRPIYYNPFSK